MTLNESSENVHPHYFLIHKKNCGNVFECSLRQKLKALHQNSTLRGRYSFEERFSGTLFNNGGVGVVGGCGGHVDSNHD